MSFAEFEQRLDESAGIKDESKASDDSFEEPVQHLSVDVQTQGAQNIPSEATAISQVQQAALSLPATTGVAAGNKTDSSKVDDIAQMTTQLLSQHQGVQNQPLQNPTSLNQVSSAKMLQTGEVIAAATPRSPSDSQMLQTSGRNAEQPAAQNMAQPINQVTQQASASLELLGHGQHFLKHQKMNPDDALSLTKTMTMPLDAALTDKMTMDITPMPAQSTHSNLVAGGSNLSAPASGLPASAAQQLYAGVDITQPEWGRDLVEQLRSRMQLSKTDQIQHAHVRLDPPELGRLEVNLRLDGDKVSVHFTAAHPQLREALAANADRLRFDFDGSQMQLADVSVSSGLYQQSHQHSGTDDESGIMANQSMIQSEEASTAAPGLDGRYEAMV